MKTPHKREPSQATHSVTENMGSEEVYTQFQLTHEKCDPLYAATVKVNKKPIKMEVDTCESTYCKTLLKEEAPHIQTCSTRLRTFTGEEIVIMGSIQVEGEPEESKKGVVKGQESSLLVRIGCHN